MEQNPQLAALPAVIAAEEAAARAKTHAELVREIVAYDAHPVAASTPAVPGRRGLLAGANPILLLGKSPAATETATGLPYQGPAGQVLRHAVEMAGHDIEQAHQTHATYWRPRKDNLPNATQIAFSRPFIEREIELVAPRRIIALGAKSMDSLFGEHPDMDEVMGTIVEYHGIPVHLLRNHGYINRHPEEMDQFVAALSRAFGD